MIQNADVIEVCDICNDIECIESHKLILKQELDEFTSTTIPLIQDCYSCLFDQLPAAIDNLKQTLQYQYLGLVENTTKTEYEEMIDILENKNNKYLPQLMDFYSNRKIVRGLQEKMSEVTNLMNLVQKFNQQFIITDTQTSKKLTKLRINHLKKEEYLISCLSTPEFNTNKVENLTLFEIPTKFKFKHLYSATWLNENHIGLAAGEYHPYIIYDPFKKYVHQQIIEDKNGVYDSITVNKSLILAYNHNIKLFHYNTKYEDSCQEFERCEGTPSKLYYCNNCVFSSDSYFNYILPINYINKWSLSTGKLTKYKIVGKAYGHLCFKDNLFCVSSFLECSKTKRQNSIYLYNSEKQTPDRKIDTKHCIRGLSILKSQLICFSDDISIWNLNNLVKQITIRYPEEKFNPHCIIFTNSAWIIGCENGSIWTCNPQFQEWEKLLKMNAKSMKISQNQEKLVISAYNCSFCVLQIK